MPTPPSSATLQTAKSQPSHQTLAIPLMERADTPFTLKSYLSKKEILPNLSTPFIKFSSTLITEYLSFSSPLLYVIHFPPAWSFIQSPKSCHRLMFFYHPPSDSVSDPRLIGCGASLPPSGTILQRFLEDVTGFHFVFLFHHIHLWSFFKNVIITDEAFKINFRAG